MSVKLTEHDRSETATGLTCLILWVILVCGGVYACHDKFAHERRAALSPTPGGEGPGHG